MYGFSKLEPFYPVETKLQVKIVALPKKENKEKKGGLEGKSWAPYLGILIALSAFLNSIRLFKSCKSILTLED